MTTQEIIDYYVGLLILQYSSQGNAVAHTQVLIGEFIQDQIVDKVNNGFDIATAIGAQLNILGTYRGAPREVFGVAPGDYWSLVPYADAAPNSYFGWAEYADPDPTWNWLQYNDLESVSSTLTDSQLRRLILLRALLQSSSMGFGDLDNILYSVFGSYVNLVDNEDMTIVYQHSSTDPDVDGLWGIAVLSDSLPHPAGVLMSIMEV